MSDQSGAADVLVVGGGVIGCAIAWELAARGVDVTIVEADSPGRGASSAAAGMLSPLSEARRPGPFLELAVPSLRAYRAFAERVQQASGVDVAYRESGKLQVALTDTQSAALGDQFAWQRAEGFEVHRLSGDEAREIEPALAPAVVAALLLPRDDQVDNRALARALWIAAARAGVRFRLGDAVERLDVAGAGARGGRSRARGVTLAGGATLVADRVVVAAGCWSGRLRGLPGPLPVRPVGGQMVALEMVPPVIEKVVLTAGCYLIPRADGRLLVGATVEERGFQARPTAGGVRSLLEAAVLAIPALAGAPLAEAWAGLRPGTPDDLPILGADPAMDGLYYATGHYRNGVLLAPITAGVMADLLTGETPTPSIDAFSVARFRSSEA